jgi:hypothetical protein
MATVTATLRSPCRGAKSYAYELLDDIHPDSLCGVCREPYSLDGEGDGCRPIRLIDCGHIIGLECFDEWTRTHPDMCTNWNHRLERARGSWWKPEQVMDRIYGTKCFTAVEAKIIADAFHNADPISHFRLTNAFAAYHGDFFSLRHAEILLGEYFCSLLGLTIALAIVVFVACVVAPSAVYLVLYLPWTNWTRVMELLLTVGWAWLIGAGCVCLSGLVFLALCMGIPVCAVSLAWWRSRQLHPRVLGYWSGTSMWYAGPDGVAHRR